MFSRSFLLLVTLFAAACAPVVRPDVSAPVPDPPAWYGSEVRDYLIGLAEREWDYFGGAELYYDTDNLPGEVQGGTLDERDPRAFARLMAYWNAARAEDREFIRRNKARQRRGEAAWWDEAWSAAFISWLLRNAGVDRDDFRWAIAHWIYVDHAIRNEGRHGLAVPFAARDPSEVAPVPGDLICNDRSRPVEQRLTSLDERRAELGRARPMHCDLVVAMEPGRVAAIGGNLRNRVVRLWLPTDGQGRLVRSLPPREPRQRTFFVVLVNRMGKGEPPYRDEMAAVASSRLNARRTALPAWPSDRAGASGRPLLPQESRPARH